MVWNFFMDFRSILVIGFALLNLFILVLGIENPTISEANVKYRHVLNDPLADNSSVFFEDNDAKDYQCFGPIYKASEIHEQISRLREQNLFPRVSKLQIDNTEKEFFVIKNVFSFEEVQIVDKELSLMGLYYFAVRFEDGYKLYIDFQDGEIDAKVIRGTKEGKLLVVESMGRQLDRVQIAGPQTLYLLILDGAKEENNLLETGKRCKGIAWNEEFLYYSAPFV